jgi:hypothetical protein
LKLGKLLYLAVLEESGAKNNNIFMKKPAYLAIKAPWSVAILLVTGTSQQLEGACHPVLLIRQTAE